MNFPHIDLAPAVLHAIGALERLVFLQYALHFTKLRPRKEFDLSPFVLVEDKI